MGARIARVAEDSPARRAGISAGETLKTIGEHEINDVLDYRFYSYERALAACVSDAQGSEREVRISKREGEDPGLEFDTYLIDSPRACANKCVFCFVDQLPPGMRESLYFKDDDTRLSLLMGNYVTLTNVSETEIDRIIKLRLSPIHLSVHTTDPDLRTRMLGSRNAGRALEYIELLARENIEMHCQIVVCPGINDGATLEKTLRDLTALWPSVASVSVVPVGLTRWREGLERLQPVDLERAREIIANADSCGEGCLAKCGARVVYCADELYIKAGLPLPGDEYYEDYPQLENGVGMVALFREEFLAALEQAEPPDAPGSCSVATGMAALPYIRELVDLAREKCPSLRCEVYGIENTLFGGQVDVAGLLPGGDLIRGLKGKDLGKRLLFPASMLRREGDLFLDDLTPEDVGKALGVSVIPVKVDGGVFLCALLGIIPIT